MLVLAEAFSTFSSGHNDTLLFQRSQGANVILSIPAVTERFCPLDVPESGGGGWAGAEKRVMLSSVEMKVDRLTHHKHSGCKAPAV